MSEFTFEDIPADCFSVVTSFFDDPFVVENFSMLSRRMHTILYSTAFMNFENVSFDLRQVTRYIEVSLGDSEIGSKEIVNIKKTPFITRLLIPPRFEDVLLKYKKYLVHCLPNLRTVSVSDLFVRRIPSVVGYKLEHVFGNRSKYVPVKSYQKFVSMKDMFNVLNSLSFKTMVLYNLITSRSFTCKIDYLRDVLSSVESVFSHITRLEIFDWNFEVWCAGESGIYRKSHQVNFFKYFPNLITLEAQETNIFQSEENALQHCEYLTNLRISLCRVCKSFLNSLPKSLKNLSLEKLKDSTTLENVDFQSLKNLKELGITLWPNISNFGFLHYLSNLRILDLTPNNGSHFEQVTQSKSFLTKIQRDSNDRIDNNNNDMRFFFCHSNVCPGSDLSTLTKCSNEERDVEIISRCSKVFCGRCQKIEVCGSCSESITDLCRDCCIDSESKQCVHCKKFTCEKCSLKCGATLHYENTRYGCRFEESEVKAKVICKACQNMKVVTKTEGCCCSCEENKVCTGCNYKLKKCTFCGVFVGCLIHCNDCGNGVCRLCKIHLKISDTCRQCRNRIKQK